jgi:hypothetical protein
MIAIILAFLVGASHAASQSSHVANATGSVSPTAVLPLHIILI